MNTTEEIIEYLMAALAEASDLHYQAVGEDAQAALFYIVKATIIQEMLEDIVGAPAGV